MHNLRYVYKGSIVVPKVTVASVIAQQSFRETEILNKSVDITQLYLSI